MTGRAEFVFEAFRGGELDALRRQAAPARLVPARDIAGTQYHAWM
jgi:hypothetical protein